ncbi:Embryo-specific protein 3 [Perilla frutescens var. frutescens]|nr:Embryo-specific protein 3 [Perilla frutescens var. frutescens]
MLLLLFALSFTASAFVDHLQQSAISIKSNQTETSCEYTVIIKTSCSSISYTTDEISLAFGDAYGNEVYEPRIDDPNTRTFERCSRYVFEVRGPCMDVICQVSLMRNGSDGWKPKTVMIYGPDLKPSIFDFDTFLLNGKWFGFDVCIGISNTAFFNYAYLF